MLDADSSFHEPLPLADKIAGGYANISGHTRQNLSEADLVLSANTEACTVRSQRLAEDFQEVLTQASSEESRLVLENLLISLPQRIRQILSLVAAGHSYASPSPRIYATIDEL